MPSKQSGIRLNPFTQQYRTPEAASERVGSSKNPSIRSMRLWLSRSRDCNAALTPPGTAIPGRSASNLAARGSASPLRSSHRRLLLQSFSFASSSSSSRSVRRKRTTIFLNRKGLAMSAALLQLSIEAGSNVACDRKQIRPRIGIAGPVRIGNHDEARAFIRIQIKSKPLFRSHTQIESVVIQRLIALPILDHSRAGRCANDLPPHARPLFSPTQQYKTCLLRCDQNGRTVRADRHG